MSYNIMVISDENLDWIDINNVYQSRANLFEIFPISYGFIENALGCCIPSTYFNMESWENLVNFILLLNQKYPLRVYDMYAGEKINIKKYTPAGISKK